MNPDCSLLSPIKGRCWRKGCEKPLPKYRRHWCSQECGEWYASEHIWQMASQSALYRDNWTCRHCGKANVPHHGLGLEVNHIVPRNGGGYNSGCWNHLAGLETLCHDCHVAVTRAQRRERNDNADGPARSRGA